MLLIPACVAVQIIGASPEPAEVGALRSRCSDILGGERCRIAHDESAPGAGAPDAVCWRATVIVADRDAAARVVLRAAPGITGTRVTHRDIAFQERDEVPERWATIGLVIAALVTIEERSALTSVDAEAPASKTPQTPPRALISATTTASPVRDVPVLTHGGAGVHAVLAGTAATGPLPGTAFGARLEAGVDWTRLGIVARFSYYPERNRATVPIPAGVGGGRFG